MTEQHVEVAENVSVSDSAQIATWTWFSIVQAQAAVLFARRCAVVEAAVQPGAPLDEAALAEDRSCAIAAVTASVAFLEATVNEILHAARYPGLQVSGKLPISERETLLLLADVIDRENLKTKFELILKFLRRQPMTPGAQPCQDAWLLIDLRNKLVHQRPEFNPPINEPGKKTDSMQLEAKLQHAFAPNNLFFGPGNAFFPDRCLGHACAVWAWKSALAFADAYLVDHLKVEPVYQNLRTQLTL